MRKTISVVCLVAGAILLFYGLQASDSLASSIKETVEGTPTDRSMWLILGGAVLAVAGIVGLVARPSIARA